jgi:hypothetical protein
MGMTHILKNKNLEIQIELPLENYNFSRFDWTGKIVAVRYKGVYVSGVEELDQESNSSLGKGFYNEFGMDNPIAFNETAEGDWFHKIGIGALKKESNQYDFSTEYKIQPATFEFSFEENKVFIECKSQKINGYSYELKKEIELLENGFKIVYRLHNTGEKTIITNEYNHNFLAINEELIGSEYILRFPFHLVPELFDATVNTEGNVKIGKNEITFINTPEKQFFFSNISGGEHVAAFWELINTKNKIGISETGSFNTTRVNLWGWKHVISPELFYDIDIKPEQVIEWSRTYNVFEIN